MVDSDGVAGADEGSAVALAPVGMAGGRIVDSLAFGQMLLLAEWPAGGRAVAVDVGFLFGAAVHWSDLQYALGQAGDGGEVLALEGGVVAVGLSYVQLLACPGYRSGVGELER